MTSSRRPPLTLLIDEDSNAPADGGVGFSGSDLTRFMALFEGYQLAYGLFDVKKADESGKMKGAARTARGAPTHDVFYHHLAGTGPGLGIIMLREDDSVLFGAIDYDNKKADHAKAAAKVMEKGLPLVVCRSKSGGIHFYCFLKDPVPASLLKERMAEWTAVLGMSATTEQFPKQSARFNENDIGSWINLPYFNADATERWAMINGQPASLGAFLDAAEAARMSLGQLEQRAIDDDENALFQEGPPCLQYLASQGGFGEGARNNGMQAVMVYLRKRHPDDWKEKVDPYNLALARLPSSEIQQIVKHNERKEYGYSCKLHPLNAHCQRRLCLQRMYGVGEGPPGESKPYDINALIRYTSAHGDEPLWSMEVNGKRVMVTNSQFYSRDEFNRQCMAQANVLPIHMPPQRWLKFLSEIIQNAETVPLPDDASPRGQLWEWVENYCLQNVNALDREEVWLGKPWRDAGRVYFRSHSLFKYLDRQGASYQSEQELYSLLRDHGAEHHTWNLKGNKFVNVWSIPAPAKVELDEEFTIGPKLAPGEDF